MTRMQSPPYTYESQVTRLAAKYSRDKAHKASKAIQNITSWTFVTFISCMSRASIKVIATIGPSPMFDPLKITFQYLEFEFGSIQHGQMDHIQDFKKEIGATPRIMHACFAKFAHQSDDAFTKWPIVSLYTTKQNDFF